MKWLIVWLALLLPACGNVDAPIDVVDDVTSSNPEDVGIGTGKADGPTSDRDMESDPIDAGSPSDMGPRPVDMSTMPDLPSGPACSTGTRDGVCLHVDDCIGSNQSVPGFCDGPTEIQCCVPVPAGQCIENPSYENMPRPNEGLEEATGDAGCLGGMTAIGSFCVDRHEASLVEVGTGRSWSPFHNPAGYDVRAVSIAGAVPQAYISAVQAATACSNSGKRLCTDNEWLRACQGPNDQTFPYGNTRQDGLCNDARSVHPAAEYFGTTNDSIYSMLDNACINQIDDSVARTGEHPQCVTDEGLFDMMGNVHEWTSNPAGYFRGGYYVDTVRNNPGCLYLTTVHQRSYWDYSTGFRCCADRQ